MNTDTLDVLKNKFKNTLHYKIQTQNLFNEYVNSLLPKDYNKKNVKISNFSYQPLNKNIHFMAEVLPTTQQFSICHININISLENNNVSYSFKENEQEYHKEDFFNKKYLFDILYNLINNIKVEKLNIIFEKSKILKKEYMKLERDILKAEEEYYLNKNKKYLLVINNMFPKIDSKDVDYLLNQYIEKAYNELYRKKPLFYNKPENVFNVLNKPILFIYLKIDKDKIELCESYINFNIDKNKKIKFKLNNEIVSKKKFMLAFSNQFYINGKIATSIEEVLENNIFHIFKEVKNPINKKFIRLKEVNIEDFCKQFLANSIADNF